MYFCTQMPHMCMNMDSHWYLYETFVWEEGHNLTHAKCVQPTFLASHLTHVSYQPDSAEPIDVGKRRVGRPRQQWLFRFKVIIHNQISPTDYDGDPFQNNKDSTGSGTEGKRKIGICIRICTYVEVHVCVYVYFFSMYRYMYMYLYV